MTKLYGFKGVLLRLLTLQERMVKFNERLLLHCKIIFFPDII